jgi:nitroimidazol reductase NimA-like FMN-containing flavoprotein (pyridoxamine 5'-phosphate oxidase superfamily)
VTHANTDDPFAITERTRTKRLPERGHYDRDTVYAILDAGLICHVGYTFQGQPYVTPTAYWREGDHLYWHGSSASRMLRTLSGGIAACVTVTHLDGLVLARSAFHHSMNYRSVMALGVAHLVTDPDEKTAALRAFTERLVEGRWAQIRPPTSQELKATMVLRMQLEEVSAKIRSGPAKDDDEDYGLPHWAGVVPVHVSVGDPIPDERLDPSITLPPSLRRIRLGQ